MAIHLGRREFITTLVAFVLRQAFLSFASAHQLGKVPSINEAGDA